MTSENQRITPDWTTRQVLALTEISKDSFDSILHFAIENNLRDIYIKSGDYLRARQHQNRLVISKEVLTHSEVKSLLSAALSSLERTDRGYSTNPAYTLTNRANRADKRNFRLSVNGFSEGGVKGYNCAIRPLPKAPPTIEEIELRKEIAVRVGGLQQGLVLLIGATGEGKTSTIAAIMRYVLEKIPNKRILEYSRPVENLWHNVSIHPSNQIVPHNVSEDGVSGDMISYEESIKTAMRQAGDWIAIGEMTEAESFEAALEFSNTGHLVSSSVHGNSVSAAYSRVYMKFDVNKRESLMDSLISETELMIAQKLYPRIDRKEGGLVACREMLDHTHDVKTRLKAALENSKSPISALRNEINQCMWDQGTTFYQDAERLCREGKIGQETLKLVERTYGKLK
ncbi:putative Twitching motility protein PilT [Vibrio nigripulchritudo SOn1]|uniref:Twitching motility protein PilT n=1 Tax=Vibrio nigripulchritudo SOn1 TaxID=1238450 RepID=A0AAV2VQ09_9VIBR|nr:ATPase, T2SS/T4P/T4SS family [Vibrio nigripulchritudo]CCO46811.1 putative Twitching motility protein PilT [Vibrio nigripulchritudo SOn1]